MGNSLNTAQFTMNTQKQVRENFWNSFPQFKSEFKVSKRQNDYKCDIRTAFVDWVDYLQKDGQISGKLAQRVTL